MFSATGLLILSVSSLISQIDGFSDQKFSLVETNAGKIRGTKASDGDYYMYMGIPYAKVEANNPFGPSIPYPESKDVLNTDVTVCPQSGYNATVDCLQLHIYVPNVITEKLPVMIWIHGGSFTTGSGADYGPKYLVSHNIIFVSLNYRLSPYGFMCLDDPKVPGNQGLKDQLLALRWVRNNIRAFGGDIRNITLAGQSAGSMSVDLHLLYNKENIFNRVILESGTALSPWINYEPDVCAPLKLATHLGFETNIVREALSFLEKQNTNDVIKSVEDLSIDFFPCIERDLNQERFITVNPINVNPPNPNISILIGNNDDELLFIFVNTNLTAYENLFENTLGLKFNFDDELTTIAHIVRNFYIGDETVSNDVKKYVVDFFSDFIVQYTVQRSINNYVKNGAKLYRYVFSYIGQRNIFRKQYNITSGGAVHADELGYLFNNSLLTQGPVSTEDATMIYRMTLLWTNFVKYGDPTPNLAELRWPPVTEDKMTYLHIDSDTMVKRAPFKERIAFWALFYAAYRELQKGL